MSDDQNKSYREILYGEFKKVGEGDTFQEIQASEEIYDLPDVLTGKLVVNKWYGHGEGGTELKININKPYPYAFDYELPENVKHDIGDGIDVVVILKRKK